ncbi:MAG: electron transport complex subunit RsxC [Cellulosilyticaceae bacterium]
MKALTFKRGIHPSYNKQATSDRPIETLMAKGEIVIPMQQHIGAPCKALVKKGDRVLSGEKIGEGTGFVSAPIYSSASGTVKAVEERMTHQGIKCLSVVIDNDGLYEEIPHIEGFIEKPFLEMSREEIVKLVKDAGIVGMGGAGFPTHVKLSPPEGKTIENIIINGAECEPYLTSDHRVMLEESERVIEGVKILKHIFPNAKATIGIEDNKKDAIEKLTQLAANEGIEICVLKTKYPQGSEKHLIAAITGKEVPSGKLPMDIGCLVQNIDSVVAIWRVVTKGRPLIRRIVTVSGSGVKNPCNVKVRIGTSFREILEYAQCDFENTVKIIAGGPMMGTAISDIDIPVVKGTSAILCFTKEDMPNEPMQNCIRCGKCVEVCPCGLVPNTLHRSALFEEYDAFLKADGMDCMECGSCSYICPSKRHLVQTIRTAKNVIRSQQNK